MQERDQQEKNKKTVVAFACISLLIVGVLSWIKMPVIPNLIRNISLSGILLVITLYEFIFSSKNNTLNYSNKENPKYFILSLIISFIIAITCAQVSPLIWPLVAVAVVLSLFSNALCGILGYIYIISIPVMLSNSASWVFLIYLLSGIVAVLGFDGWERDFKSVKPFVLLSSCLIFTQAVSIWTFSNFNQLVFIILPAFLNLFINIFFIYLFLKRFTLHFLKTEQDQYMDINDQGYILMEKLKEDSIDDYYRCVHTAHFADIMCNNLKADAGAVRSAAYYYRFGVIYSRLGVTGLDMSEYMLLMMDAHHFPSKAREVIEELCNKRLVSKESAIVFIADYFIKSISFLMKERPDKKPDWDRCVDYIFDKSIDENVFEQCAITVGELKTCMTLLKRDKMYYEFLCRK